MSVLPFLLIFVALYTHNVLAKVQIRLVGGKHRYEGRVEIKYQGIWKGVCDHGWNREGALVACRMLNYPGVTRYTRG